VGVPNTVERRWPKAQPAPPRSIASGGMAAWTLEETWPSGSAPPPGGDGALPARIQTRVAGAGATEV
jgi:hypothetical protein